MNAKRFLRFSVTLIFLLASILPLTAAQARPLFASGDFVWAKGMGGTSSEQGKSITVDNAGNIYTTGVFQGTVDFDPGPGVANLTSAGDKDIFVSKLSSNGDFIWAKRMGGTSQDQGFDIALDSAGNIYTVGDFQGTADFDPGAGTASQTSAGEKDIFISKLSSNGNFVWVKTMGWTSSETGVEVGIDGSGNIYTTGLFYSEMIDFDPDPTNSFLLTNAGNSSSDAYILKLNNSGDFIWAKSLAGIGEDIAYGIFVENGGSLYTTGEFCGTTDFDPGLGTANLTSIGNCDIFVSKLDGNGGFVWARNMGGISSDGFGVSINLDGNGNVYTVGGYRNTVDVDPGPGAFSLTSTGDFDIFVSKLDKDGNFIWAGSLGGPDLDGWGSGGFYADSALDTSGNIYIIGDFFGTSDYDPSPNATFYLTSNGGSDVFISALSSTGNFLWAENLGGSGGDDGGAIAIRSNGQLVITGDFSGTVDFDPGTGVSSLISTGQTDIFVASFEGTDLVAPKVNNVTSSVQNKSYGVGAVIPITVTFSEPVVVIGTPKLTLETGALDRAVSYTGGSGTNTLTFPYTVQAGDASTDLNYVSTTSLALNGGTIKDSSNNNALLTLPALNATGSLGTNKNILVDGVAPTTLSFSYRNPAGSPTDADILIFRAAFSEAVSQVDASDFALNGTSTATVTNVTAVNSSTYDVTVSGGNLASFNGEVGLNLNSSQNILDIVGNALPTAEPAVDQIYTVDNLNLNMSVFIGGILQGSYSVPPQGSLRQSYANVDSGPVKVMNTKNIPIIASERINLKTYDPLESYSEGMGLPASKLSDTYIFPWYNNTGFQDSQLRFANVGNANTVVTVKIGGVAQSPTYPLAPNQSVRVSFPGVDSGPVEVKSSNGVPIIAALRINLKVNSPFTSYSEFLGLSASNTASTRYIFPWYNNTGLLDSQLRFGNVGSAATTVTVKIGGVAQPTTYTLDPNESTRISYALDNGPVEVSSSGGVPITAAMRINLKNNTAFTSYTELMGLTGASLTDTRYLFPWYNNTGLLDSQLRFANVGNANTTVSIKVNGVVQPTTYALRPNESVRVSLAGVDNGPIEVYSSGNVPIIAALRINLKANTSYDSYYEFMGSSVGTPLGLPGDQRSTTYWFPWYNNTGLLDSQLRFGVP